MKRFCSLSLLLLVLLFSLAGCGSTTGSTPAISAGENGSAGISAAGSGSQSSAPESSDAAASAAQSAENEDFYFVSTNFSKTEVEQFASQVRNEILSADWAGLAENIAYPITIGGTEYADGAAFSKAPLDTLLDASFLDAIKNEDCAEMFCNSDGIMMGNGEIWIAELLNDDLTSQGLRVIAINVSGKA